MSNQVEEMLGYTADQWMTAPGFWPSIVHQDDRSRFVREAIEIFTSEKGSGSHQYRCLTKDGRTVWLESRASAIREKTGTPIGLRGVTIDISERKEAQAALLRAQEELARVTRGISMGEVAASIAHEINQPLAAVVTNGEACLRFLAATAPNIEKAKVILTSIISDGNRASDKRRQSMRQRLPDIGIQKSCLAPGQKATVFPLAGIYVAIQDALEIADRQPEHHAQHDTNSQFGGCLASSSATGWRWRLRPMPARVTCPAFRAPTARGTAATGTPRRRRFRCMRRRSRQGSYEGGGCGRPGCACEYRRRSPKRASVGCRAG